MGCCADPPPPPDYSALAEGSEEVARIAQETARENLAWAREQDGLNRETLNRVLDIQLPMMEETFRNALADRARYTDVFQPLEDELIAEAKEFATPERQALEAGRAIQDVGASFDAERANSQRHLESFGLDPEEVFRGLDSGVRTAAAAAKAFAGTNAARRTEDMGRAMRADAINIGRGMPSQVAQSYGTSLAAGNSAVGGGNQTTGTSAAALGLANQGYNTALSGYNTSAGIQNTGYNNALDAWSMGQQLSPWAGIGNIAGQWAGSGFGWGEEGGKVPQDLSATPGPNDSIPAILAPGEYVVPAEVVRAKGTEFFDKLNERYTGKKKEA